MTKIEDMIKDLCPNGIEWKELGEVSTFYGGLTGKKKSDFEDGNAKYVTYKNIFGNIQVEQKLLETVQVDVDENQNSIKYGDILITGSSESKDEAGMSSSVTFVPDEPIYLNSFSFGIRFNGDFEMIPEFSKYLFRSRTFRKQIEKTASGVTRYNVSKASFKKIKVPVVPLDIQEKIVQILDKFTDYVTELTSELTLRQKQYSFYRDKLLSFEDEIYQVEWKTLGEVAECLAGATPKTSNSLYWENGTIPWMSSGEVNKSFVYDTEKKITQEGYDSCSTKIVPKETVVIALAGQGKTRGTVAITKIELCTNQSLCSIVPKDDVNSHYLYYYLKGQYQKFRDISSGEGTRGGLNLKMVRNFRIPVPSLDIQSRIVQVLDNFDTVCNDLNIGLPKEIELRQKQYEYFRDKLLTFTAEGVYTDSTVQYSTVQTRPD